MQALNAFFFVMYDSELKSFGSGLFFWPKDTSEDVFFFNFHNFLTFYEPNQRCPNFWVCIFKVSTKCHFAPHVQIMTDDNN